MQGRRGGGSDANDRQLMTFFLKSRAPSGCQLILGAKLLFSVSLNCFLLSKTLWYNVVNRETIVLLFNISTLYQLGNRIVMVTNKLFTAIICMLNMSW